MDKIHTWPFWIGATHPHPILDHHQSKIVWTTHKDAVTYNRNFFTAKDHGGNERQAQRKKDEASTVLQQNRSRDLSNDHFSKKILKLTKLVVVLRKEVKQYHFFIHINKFLSLHVWNDSPLHFTKKTEPLTPRCKICFTLELSNYFSLKSLILRLKSHMNVH